MPEQETKQTEQPKTESKPAVAPDLNDFSAYEKARESGWVPEEKAGFTAPEQTETSPTDQPAKTPASEAATGQDIKQTKESEEKPKPKSTEPDDYENSPKFFRRELRRINRGYKEENDQLRAELEAVKARLVRPPSAAPAPPVPQEPKEPKEKDFDTHEEFVSAREKFIEDRAVYRAKKAAAEEIAAFQKKVQKQLEQEDQDAAVRAQAKLREQADKQFAEQVDDARERYEDFDEVVFDPNLKITSAMDYFVHKSPKGADVAYHVASNPKEAERISKLPDVRQIIELGKIEAKFLSEEKPPSQQQPGSEQNQQAAPNNAPKPKPDPPTRIGGGANISASDDPNDPNVMMDFRRWEKAKIARDGAPKILR